MHELAICQALLTQVERVTREHRGGRVQTVTVRVGPLSGVEPELLARAFEFARAGGSAAAATLRIEAAPVRIACLECRAESEAAPNRLVCAACGGWRTRLVSGDELQLKQIEFRADAAEARAHGPEEALCATPAAAT